MASCHLMFSCILLSTHFFVYVISQQQIFYTFETKDASGDVVSLDKYKGKVTLVTNVASYCGYTDGHYRQYVQLKEEYGDSLNILAFPCNQFGEQEPEDVDTIINNMRNKYGVNFEIFGKIDVVGDDVPDFWKYLTEESKTVPQWNFYKYLVDAHGQVLGAWGPRANIDSVRPLLESAVRRAQSDREEL